MRPILFVASAAVLVSAPVLSGQWGRSARPLAPIATAVVVLACASALMLLMTARRDGRAGNFK